MGRLKNETLEEMVNRITFTNLDLKTKLKQEIAKREESEYRHAVTAEALENLLDNLDKLPLPKNTLYYTRNAAREALNGIES